MAKCSRCGEEFTPPDAVCAGCSDELRAEQDAYCAQAQAEAEAEAYARWKDNGGLR